MKTRKCPDCGAEMQAMGAVTGYRCSKCRCVIDGKGRLFKRLAEAVLADHYDRQGEEEKADKLAFGRLEVKS